MKKAPSTDEAISRVGLDISEEIWKKHGEHILRHIEAHPVEGEHPYAAALRLGISIFLREAVQE